MKIGLTLSGGGFRATVFHLGVLARLAEEDRLKDVTFLSTVSGGSLCGALVFAQSGHQWPTSNYFLDTVIPKARKLLTTYDVEQNMIWRVLRNPLHFFETRADDLAALIAQRWGVRGKLKELPPSPRWLINATCYETGQNWRFERFRMGDSIFGYSYDTDLPLSHAVASSCGFPGLIGALYFNTPKLKWFKYDDPSAPEPADESAILQIKTTPTQPSFSQLHLWDGGVFDNLGLEGVMNPLTGWHQGIDFLIASGAGGKAKSERYRVGLDAVLRIIAGVMMDQILALRARELKERIKNHGDQGAFLSIDDTSRQILANCAGLKDVDKLIAQCLSDKEANLAANTPTTLRRLSPAEFDRLYRHGFEIADSMFYTSYPKQFNYIGYSNSRWGQKGPG